MVVEYQGRRQNGQSEEKKAIFATASTRIDL